MHIKHIAVIAAVLGTASFTIHAGELVAKNTNNGRAGMQTVLRVETEKPTIALSKQGQGVGKSEAEQQPVKAQWHNPSRQLIHVTAHN